MAHVDPRVQSSLVRILIGAPSGGSYDVTEACPTNQEVLEWSLPTRCTEKKIGKKVGDRAPSQPIWLQSRRAEMMASQQIPETWHNGGRKVKGHWKVDPLPELEKRRRRFEQREAGRKSKSKQRLRREAVSHDESIGNKNGTRWRIKRRQALRILKRRGRDETRPSRRRDRHDK